MTIASLLTLPCTIVRRSPTGTEDDYGNEIPGESTVSTLCELQQRQRGETEETVSDTSWLLVLPADTDVDSADVVIVAGKEYEMAGDPWVVRDPETGVLSHTEATVVRTAGAHDGGAS